MLASLLIPVCAQAQVAQLRIASVVPKNSLYHQSILELGESWRTAQGAGARFTVFTDGSQGGEAEIVRRMRIGQLQGALISVVGLRDIEPSTPKVLATALHPPSMANFTMFSGSK